MSVKVYYESDTDVKIVQSKKVAVIGYGSQGYAHANNLKDSGVQVNVALREGSKSFKKVEAAGLEGKLIEEAVAWADIVTVLAPDESQANLYSKVLEPNLKKGAALVFATGFSVHFGLVKPHAELDVIMVAPKGPGHLVRSTYIEGTGVPSLIAVYQDYSGRARDIALSYASALGGARAGIIETTFRNEIETDLFGEQVVLCGGLTALIRSAFEVLVEAGYPPEMAYFECLHEVKLIADLIYEGGIADMRYSVSSTAEYGDISRGSRIINKDTKREMHKILEEIQNGEFAREFMLEHQTGGVLVQTANRTTREHLLERIGRELRSMMPWLNKGKLVDRSQN
jgi:ketol-acid reductoisomerase